MFVNLHVFSCVYMFASVGGAGHGRGTPRTAAKNRFAKGALRCLYSL